MAVSHEVVTDSTLEKGHNPQETSDSLANDTTQKAREPEPPEGGRKAWLSLVGSSLAMFVSFGWVNCIALFQAEYETNQLKQYNQSTVSWITSTECEPALLSLKMQCEQANRVSSFLHVVHVSPGWQAV